MLFQTQLADAADYPRPVVPMHSEMMCGNWFNNDGVGKSIFLDERSFFWQGRYALAAALIELGIVDEVGILLPSYHCRSLVEPAQFLRAKIHFYPMQENLSPMKDVLLNFLENARQTLIKVMVIPHYFGFPQQIEELAELCASENVYLIEDCAHAFYGKVGGNLIGSYGQFAIASPRKFFPTENGGVLVDNRKKGCLNPSLKRLSKVSEVKSIVRSIVQLINCNSSRSNRMFEPIQAPDLVSFKNSTLPDAPICKAGFKCFEPAKLNVSGYKASQWIMNNASHGKIIVARRKNYNKWLEGVKNIQDCHALFNTLPEGVVPYVFPLVLDCKPEMAFHFLKMAGVPMLRWEDMAVTDCEVSNNYRLSLIQLPCHQSLSDEQLDWMINTVRVVISSISGENA